MARPLIEAIAALAVVAIALGWLGIRRRLPGRQFAWAGVGLGAAATLAAIVLLRLMPRGITGRFFRKSL